MVQKFFHLLVLGSFFIFVPIGALLARMTSDNYIIFGDVFSEGGLSTSTSQSYSLHDTIGEAVVLSATSTSANFGIKAGFQELNPDQVLTFTVSDTALDLGTLSDASASTNSHTMTIDTNAVNGFTVTVSGSTLTKGSATISAIGATAAASNPGSEQFGINLVANTGPAVGADPSGTSPIGSAAGEYGTANSFAFQSGDTVASANNDINQTTFTVSYLANIHVTTEPGTYTTTLTYSATGNF